MTSTVAAGDTLGQAAWVSMPDGCEIFVHCWGPDTHTSPVRGVLHICHGMAEHGQRYEDLGKLLAKEGFVTYAADHRAHGRTAQHALQRNEKGHWLGHVEVPGGATLAVPMIVEDQARLCVRESNAHPGAPFVIFGHSMGSVIATLVAATPDVCGFISGLLLSGAPARLPALHAMAFKPLLAMLRAIHGGSGVAPLISKLTFDKFNAKFAPNATTDDWLNRDPVEVQKYLDDPLCGFKVSVDFMRSFIAALTMAGSRGTLEKIRVPVMLMNGGDDAVTVNDLGTRSHEQILAEFAAAGLPPPKIIIYGQARHELTHELCHEEVASDILTFLNRRCTSADFSKAPRSRL